MPKPAFDSPEYQHALATCVRWDPEREEPYLQLPSFPDLRLTPFRAGIEDEYVTLFNHKSIGQRLYTLPWPMDRTYVDEWVAGTQPLMRASVAQLVDALAAPLPDTASAAATTPLAARADAHIASFPFKTLRSVSTGKVVGDYHMAPMTEGQGVHPDMPDKRASDITPADMLALAPEAQVWQMGYVLDPAYSGRGITTEAVACVLAGWVVPWMKVGKMCAWIEYNNPASAAILMRNGFEFVADEPAVEKTGRWRFSGFYARTLRADARDGVPRASADWRAKREEAVKVAAVGLAEMEKEGKSRPI